MMARTDISIGAGDRARMVPITAATILTFLQGSRRTHWSMVDLAHALHFKFGRAQVNIGHLVKAGLVKKKRVFKSPAPDGSWKGQNYCLYSLVGRSEPMPVPDTYSLVLAYLRKKCARTGTFSCNRSTIAKAIGRSVDNVKLNQSKLRKDGLIDWTHHGYYNTYAIVGQSAPAMRELTPLSPLQAELVKFLKSKSARDGICSLPLDAIAEAMGRSKDCILGNIAKLENGSLVTVTRKSGHANAYSVPAGQARRSAAKRGRAIGSVSAHSKLIIDRWIDAGKCCPPTVQFLDDAAAIAYPREFSKAIPGTKKHKRVRDRIRGVIVRYQASLGKKKTHFRSATKIKSVAS